MFNLAGHKNYKQQIDILEVLLQDEMKSIGIGDLQLPGKKK